MAKSKTKSDYTAELIAIAESHISKLTVKQLRQLITKHAPS